MSLTPEQPKGNDLDRIDQEAADWISRMDRGLSEEEEQAFLEWLEQDPIHGKQLQELQDSWLLCDKISPNTLLAGQPTAASKLHSLRHMRKFLIRTCSAAAIILLSFGLFWAWKTSFSENAKSVFLADGDYALIYERHVLEDGSVVELNTGSQVEVRFSEKVRWLRLHVGEAHFIVSKNQNRPFIVDVRGFDIRAIGTAFSVKMDDSTVEVLVTEGRVSVEQRDLIAEGVVKQDDMKSSVNLENLTAGQKSIFFSSAWEKPPEIEEPSVDEITRQLSWRDEILEFSSTRLSEVVEAFNQRNFVQIVIVDRELTRLKINAAVNPSNLDNFIELLEMSAGVRSERTDSGAILLRKSDN